MMSIAFSDSEPDSPSPEVPWPGVSDGVSDGDSDGDSEDDSDGVSEGDSDGVTPAQQATASAH